MKSSMESQYQDVFFPCEFGQLLISFLVFSISNPLDILLSLASEAILFSPLLDVVRVSMLRVFLSHG